MPILFLLGALLAAAPPPDADRAREAFARRCLEGDRASCTRLEAKDLAGGVRLGLSVLVDRVRRHAPLTAWEVLTADALEVRVLRNTVFAAHGLRFRSPELRAFFSGHHWYAANRASVDEASLGAEDRRNLALLRAAEARPPPAPRTSDDGARLADAIAFAEDEGDAPLDAEERALAGQWTWGGGSPAEAIRIPRESWELLENRKVVRRVEDCGDLRVARLGFWEARGGELRIRWFAELRRTGATAAEDGGDCPDWTGSPPALVPATGEEVVPFSPERHEDGGGPSRTFGHTTYWR